MNTTRSCGCKGYRTCLICENDFQLKEKEYIEDVKTSYIFCPFCNKAWEGWDYNLYKTHPQHTGESVSFPGIFIKLDFLTEEEENRLMKGIDEMPWDLSQSGRRKQNFGPKTNFKKKKLKVGEFRGFPEFSKFVQEKFEEIPMLRNYRTIEQCSLEYDPNRGAAIDPHIDDCWIWGERIITVNCLADSVLTMTPYKGQVNKYNLAECSTYNRVLNDEGELFDDTENISVPYLFKNINTKDMVVRIPMPRRSLLIISGEARYNWEHCILRDDVKERRVCLAYREFTPPYLRGGMWESEGSKILHMANVFWNHLDEVS